MADFIWEIEFPFLDFQHHWPDVSLTIGLETILVPIFLKINSEEDIDIWEVWGDSLLEFGQKLLISAVGVLATSRILRSVALA